MQQRERVLMEREERMQREWQRVRAMRPNTINSGNNNNNASLPRPSYSSPSPLGFPMGGMYIYIYTMYTYQS